MGRLLLAAAAGYPFLPDGSDQRTRLVCRVVPLPRREYLVYTKQGCRPHPVPAGTIFASSRRIAHPRLAAGEAVGLPAAAIARRDALMLRAVTSYFTAARPTISKSSTAIVNSRDTYANTPLSYPTARDLPAHPCPKQTEHVLTVALHGDDGSLWEAVLNLDMRPAAARKLLVFGSGAAQADGAAIRPVSGPKPGSPSGWPARHRGQSSTTGLTCPITTGRPRSPRPSRVARRRWLSWWPHPAFVWRSMQVPKEIQPRGVLRPCDTAFDSIFGSLMERKTAAEQSVGACARPADPLRVCLVQVEATLLGQPPEHRELAPNHVLVTTKVS